MAEETTDAAKESEQKPDDKAGKPDQQQQTADQRTDADIEAIASQADKPDAVRRALQAERDAAKAAREELEAARAEVKKYQDKDKSEQQKLADDKAEAEGRATAAEKKLLRFQVAAAKNLPMDLAERLQGDTKAQLEADADRLLELVKPNQKPSGDADAGKGEGGAGNSFNDQIRAKLRG